MSLAVTGLKEAYKAIQNVRKQTTYATSLTINDCLKAAQSHTVDTMLPDRFTLRSTWYKPGRKTGFNIQFARPNKLEGRMGTRADWMDIQEKGGIKTRPKSLAIPQEARPSETARIPKRNKPKSLLARKNAFFIRSKRGKAMLMLRAKRQQEAKVMYVMQPEAKVKPVLQFKRENTALVQGLYESLFAKNFAFAMRTAR